MELACWITSSLVSWTVTVTISFLPQSWWLFIVISISPNDFAAANAVGAANSSGREWERESLLPNELFANQLRVRSHWICRKWERLEEVIAEQFKKCATTRRRRLVDWKSGGAIAAPHGDEGFSLDGWWARRHETAPRRLAEGRNFYSAETRGRQVAQFVYKASLHLLVWIIYYVGQGE